MTGRRSAILAIALSLGLIFGGCGDNTASDSANDDNTSEDGGSEAAEGAITVKLSGESLEVPDEIAGGVVEVTVESDLDEPEVNFTKVAAGTSEADFRNAVAAATSGGAIQPILEATAGVTGFGEGGELTQSIQLPAGDYFAWADRVEPDAEGEEGGEEAEGAAEEAPEGEEGEGEDEAPNPEAFLVSAVKVTGDGEGELPDTGSTITARDYSFDVKVKAGGDQLTFRNEGPDQFHHVVLMNFGSIDAETVEENLAAFLETEGEGEPPAPLKEVDMEKVFSTGGSGVFSPGLGGTANAKFESGNTYAAICFIQDRAGGPPHVFAKGMQSVFTVE